MTFYICLFLIIGMVATGIYSAIARHNGNEFEFSIMLICPIIWPLYVFLIGTFGIDMITYWVLYSKKDKVAAVTKRLKGEKL